MKRMHRSRALAEAGYDVATRTLRVRFEHGGVYDYLEVPEEVYDALVTSAHPWSEWGEHIRERYEFQHVA